MEDLLNNVENMELQAELVAAKKENKILKSELNNLRMESDRKTKFIYLLLCHDVNIGYAEIEMLTSVNYSIIDNAIDTVLETNYFNREGITFNNMLILLATEAAKQTDISFDDVIIYFNSMCSEMVIRDEVVTKEAAKLFKQLMGDFSVTWRGEEL